MSHSTPSLLIVSRMLFTSYFLFFFFSLREGWFAGSLLTPYWLAYLIVLYVIAEKIYASFLKRGIDVIYAFPILFVVYQVNFVSMLLRSQETGTVLNRVEHFITYLLVSYIVWQFFLRYLPHTVWQEHPYYTSILVLSVTSMFGVINELVELFMDMNFHTYTIGPRFDTNLDLLMNLLGAGLFLSVQLIMHESAKSRVFKGHF